MMMKRIWQLILLLVGCALLLSFGPGCAYTLQTYTPARELKIRLDTRDPEARYSLQIDGKPALFSAEKRADILLPPYRPGCDVYLFNFLKIYNAPRSPTLVVRKDGKKVRSLRESKVRDLPVEPDGYYVLKLR